MADDRVAAAFRPWQPHAILWKLVRMRNIKRRRKRWLFADLVEAKELRDLDDRITAAVRNPRPLPHCYWCPGQFRD